MADASEPTALLEEECRVFTRYLVGHDPDAGALAAYVRAHERDARLSHPDARARDEKLLLLARRGPRRARAADACARIFAPTSRLRRKLVCLLAVLEVRGSTALELDTADGGSSAVFLARCVLLCAAAGGRALAALLLLSFERLGERG